MSIYVGIKKNLVLISVVVLLLSSCIYAEDSYDTLPFFQFGAGVGTFVPGLGAEVSFYTLPLQFGSFAFYSEVGISYTIGAEDVGSVVHLTELFYYDMDMPLLRPYIGVGVNYPVIDGVLRRELAGYNIVSGTTIAADIFSDNREVFFLENRIMIIQPPSPRQLFGIFNLSGGYRMAI